MSRVLQEFAGAPLIETTAVPACAVCGGRTTSVHATGYDYELQTCANEWTFVQCVACDHVWLNPRPSVAALATIYPPSYYAYDYESRINPVARWGKSVLDSRKLARILRRLARAPKSYIDIGCGSGRYLRAMEARGLARRDIRGLELDQKVVEQLSHEGFDVACARAEDAEVPDGSIDLATMFHVLEHVDAPDRVVARVAGWLAPGAVLAVETPNLDSLDRRLFGGGYWGGYHIPRHWHLFTRRTLERLLRSAGLEPVETLYQTGHSFWMYSVHHWARYARGWPRLALVFDPFRSVVPLAAFTAFDVARSALGSRTSAMLTLARKPN